MANGGCDAAVANPVMDWLAPSRPARRDGWNVAPRAPREPACARVETLPSYSTLSLLEEALPQGAVEAPAERFHRLAGEWSSETASTSSLTAIAQHPAYREIVGMKWDALPSILEDLRANHGYWFPALEEITGIRPFDRRDFGNGRRMREAWLDWGKKRGLIR